MLHHQASRYGLDNHGKWKITLFKKNVEKKILNVFIIFKMRIIPEKRT